MSERMSKPESILFVEVCKKDFSVKSNSTFVYVSNEEGVLKVIYNGDVQQLLNLVVEHIPSINIFK